MDDVMRSHLPQAESNIPLTSAAPGEKVELLRVQGGRGLATRLATMGLTPGVRFRVESGGRAGPVLIGVGTTRFILGHGMAARMVVHPVDTERHG
jgi:Fe2+ transport system protein FeoA